MVVFNKASLRVSRSLSKPGVLLWAGVARGRLHWNVWL